MNQGLHEYAGRIGIRIVADRGQWFFDIGPMSGDALREQEAFDIETWSACLGEPTLFHDPRATLDLELDAWPEVIANSWWLEPQLDYLKRHLEQIEQLCDPTLLDGTLACLMENRARSDDVGSGFLR